MSESSRALLDTSVFIAVDAGREADRSHLPLEWTASVVTLGELTAGVLAAADVSTRARRLVTLGWLRDLAVLPITEAVAAECARLRVQLATSGRRMNVNDMWIAATAMAHRLPVLTQDADFEVLADFSELQVVRL